MPWQSKGLNEEADSKKQEFLNVIEHTSQQGEWLVITDASPCVLSIQPNEKNSNLSSSQSAPLLDVTQFIAEQVLPKIIINKTNEAFMLHTSCSSKKMDEGQYLQKIAHACSTNIIIPKDIYCCGFAGDKGFYQPALNKAALAPLKAQIPKHCSRGLSNSRTCEIGLSEQSGISYQSILYLLDQQSEKG